MGNKIEDKVMTTPSILETIIIWDLQI